MYELDITSPFGFLSSLWALILGSVMLDPAAFRSVLNGDSGWWLAFTVLILGGISLTIGQSVVLFLNRVTPRRFVASLIVAGILFAVGALTWIVSSWLIAFFLFERRQSLSNVTAVISLGYAPFIFGFLILLPYFGPFLNRVLHVWNLVAVLLAIIVAFHVTFWQALMVGGLGWLFIEGMERFAQRPLDAARRWIWRKTTGVERQFDFDEFMDWLSHRHKP